MDDEDRVPAPREGGREFSGHPYVPAPRAAPALECLPSGAGTVATITERSASTAEARTPSSALVPTDRRGTALAVRQDTVSSRLRALGRDVVRIVTRVVGAAVAGVRSLLEGLVPCPAPR